MFDYAEFLIVLPLSLLFVCSDYQVVKKLRDGVLLDPKTFGL